MAINFAQKFNKQIGKSYDQWLVCQDGLIFYMVSTLKKSRKEKEETAVVHRDQNAKNTMFIVIELYQNSLCRSPS